MSDHHGVGTQASCFRVIEPPGPADIRTIIEICRWGAFVSIDLALDHFDLPTDAVRDRFRSAHRRGTHLWLWPEITTERWQEALFQIERATRLILTGGNSMRASLEGRADDIGIAAFTSGMGPLLGYWAEQGLLDADPPIRAVLQLHYYHNCRRMEQLVQHASAVVEALATAGIRVTVLKGMHTAFAYFPRPGTRPVSDVDLLIAPSDKHAAAKVLRILGYLPGAVSTGEQSWRMSGSPTEPRSLSLTHQDNPWVVDLHTSLDRRYSPGAPVIALDGALGSCREQWGPAPHGQVLPLSELAFHLAFHASTPFASLTLIRLTELVLVIRSIGDERRSVFWDRFLVLAQQTGVASCVYPALHFANSLVQGTVPEKVLQTLRDHAPPAVRRVVGRLTPSTCQGMRRYSLEERFMWTSTFRGWAREILLDLFPPVGARELLRIYAWRFRVLARGPITR